MLAILILKALLTSNIYLPCFFVLLKQNGLENVSILAALSLGTIVMIVGDFLTSFLVDRFGPKRPIICAACIQSISVLLLVNCNSSAMLNMIELLIGLSFPAILGADSKWLRAVCPKNARYEKYNQMTFWGAQVLSAGIGASLINKPELAHYVSASCYLLGALLACSLKECSPNSGNFSLKMTLMETKRIIFSKYRLILSQSFLLGTLGTSSWLFQEKMSSFATGNATSYLSLQLLLPISAFLTTFLTSRQCRFWYLAGMLSVMGIYLTPHLSSAYLILLIFVLASAARGILSIITREQITIGLTFNAPIATLIFIASSGAKLVQCLTMMALA